MIFIDFVFTYIIEPLSIFIQKLLISYYALRIEQKYSVPLSQFFYKKAVSFLVDVGILTDDL